MHTSLYTVQPIPLHEEVGFTALAFALPEILQQWGGHVREISLDSACRCCIQLQGSNVNKF
jgi:hypothetical protein